MSIDAVLIGVLLAALLTDHQGVPFRLRKSKTRNRVAEDPPQSSGDNQEDGEKLKFESDENSAEEYYDEDGLVGQDYVKEFAYDPTVKGLEDVSYSSVSDRIKRLPLEEYGEPEYVERPARGCCPPPGYRTMQDLTRAYKALLLSAKHFVRAANRTLMDRVLMEPCCDVSNMQDEGYIANRQRMNHLRRKEKTTQEEDDIPTDDEDEEPITRQVEASARTWRRKPAGVKRRGGRSESDRTASTEPLSFQDLQRTAEVSTTA